MGLKNHLFTGLILGYVLLSFFLYISIETQTICLFLVTYKYLALPVALVTYFFVRLTFPLFFKVEKRSWIWQASVALTIMGLAFSPPYVSFFNAVLPVGQKERLVEGRIVKKSVGRGKYGSGKRLVRLDALNCCNGQYTFVIRDESVYQALAVGDTYQRALKMGAFGLPYRRLLW